MALSFAYANLCEGVCCFWIGNLVNGDMTMKTWVKAAVIAVLAMPAMATAADAPKLTCYDIRYSLDFLNTYPTAPAICEEVREVDGVKYAKMNATVVRKEKGFTVVAFKDVFGNKLQNLQIEAVEGSTVMVDDKAVEWKNVRVGDKLSFYLPERSMLVVGQPGRGKAGAPIIFKSTAD